jgi:hypothetical protein
MPSATLQVPASPPEATGSIFDSSNPSGAEVYLDNQFQGIAPVTMYNVAPGSHIIIMKLLNYSDWSTSVNAHGGQETLVRVLCVPGSTPTPVPTRALSPVPLIDALVICAIVVVSRFMK